MQRRPRDAEEVYGCRGDPGMLRRSRGAEEVQGCRGDPGIQRGTKDVKEVQGCRGGLACKGGSGMQFWEALGYAAVLLITHIPVSNPSPASNPSRLIGSPI